MRWECSGVGTDESGTGGLFGSSVFVGVKVTKSLLKKIKQHDWFKRVEKVRDSKEFSEEECIDLSLKIEKVLTEGKDFIVWELSLFTHNNIWERHKDSNRIKCICHNWIHRELNEESTFHVIDNFLKSYTYQYYIAPKGVEIIPIDKFFVDEENKSLSIYLAFVIATGRYLRNLKKFSDRWGINLDNTLNRNCSPKKIESILHQLEKQGCKREFVFSNFCKKDVLEIQYMPKLSHYLSNKK